MIYAFFFLQLALKLGFASAVPPAPQAPLIISEPELKPAQAQSRKLTGKFLHITDFHPDPYYQTYSSTDKGDACHKGTGPAGLYGAEASSCDSPISLVNETFKWIDRNIKDEIDFVVWTGDSARHDNDEDIPRSQVQVVEQNELLVSKFVEVFGKSDNINDTDPTNDFIIPIVPTFGNNDILPHNIFEAGPNRWTKKYTHIWRQFIPEEQRHGFEQGGWFYVEVIPRKLAVFSLNTIYFFDSNSAVDGCAAKSEPGYQHLEWLRIQLQFLRDRSMKALIIGHVPPARTEAKMSWDETCWQKYTLWMRQYRDVVVGSMYGHMNIDHFMLQDFKDIDMAVVDGSKAPHGARVALMTTEENDISVLGAADYLIDLRNDWAKLPTPPSSLRKGLVEGDIWGATDEVEESARKGKKRKSESGMQKKYLDKIGGPWGESFSVSHVQASVVPNYFPTIRIFEYNITGLEDATTATAMSRKSCAQEEPMLDGASQILPEEDLADEGDEAQEEGEEEDVSASGKKAKKGKKSKKPRKSKRPRFAIPLPPPKTAPPGPAYSPQTFSLLGYTQYFANLTEINNDFQEAAAAAESVHHKHNDSAIIEGGWNPGKHHGKKPHDRDHTPYPRRFEYEVEYDTLGDEIFELRDLTVRNFIDLAQRIGEFKPKGRDHMYAGDAADTAKTTNTEDKKMVSSTTNAHEDEADVEENKDITEGAAKKKHKHKKSKKRKAINKVWFTFIKRAFVGTIDEQEIHEQFGQVVRGEVEDGDVEVIL
ncbi:hypothetical protein B0A49_03562 [Cryomyces minteri]|uniref:Endopolyphosphatase n=2 Tax=Cryomyces minteri TaxID=331657 RepID=A0A4U0XCP5_9PEZI|nr:hypothetical protein B0A49_03562 [Cryomyces minteri]